ncbi:MAG: hypothetical protein B6V02_03350 [Thermoprotei archaeon ex4572_64]|nr:MAG: hypothetical protein B6V02_03350 [Thermoprotei archaeon ex4572_64]
MNYLFETSSILLTLKLGKVELLYGQYINVLSLYELGNIIWSEVYVDKKLGEDDGKLMLDVLRRITNYVNVLDIRGLESQILDVSLRLGLTFYDASYIVLTKNYNLTLVTEDSKLQEKASRLVNVCNVHELISR